MTFPMVNPKPLGWALFEALTSSQMSQVNANAAAAADGSIWADVTLAQVISKVDVGYSGPIVGYDAFYRFFYSFGSNGTTPFANRSKNGRVWYGMTIPAGSGYSISSSNPNKAFASDGAGTIVIGGVATGGINAYRRSTDGIAWTGVPDASGSAQDVKCIRWVPFLGLFIAGRNTGGQIETSPTGATWTGRTTPDTNIRNAIADNGSIVVVASNGTNDFITSPDGINWTARTTTALAAPTDVIWSPSWGKFFAIDGSALASSSDGINWSTTGLAYPGASTRLATFGRVIYSIGVQTSGPATGNAVLRYSIDGGASWAIVQEFDEAPGDGTLAISPSGQMVLSTGGGAAHNHYAMLRGGV